MKPFRKVSVILILMLLPLASQGHMNVFKGYVTGVVNNYTIEVFNGGEVVVVRLAEIICPSAKFGSFPCAEEAKRFLREITSGREVTAYFWVKDTYGRSVCEVYLPDGSSLSNLMVSRGYALQDPYYSDSTKLKKTEETAKRNKQGVWNRFSDEKSRRG
jgi:endonuclease YncB( thermonuclease family)